MTTELPDRYIAARSLTTRTLSPITARQIRVYAEGTHYAWSRLVNQFGSHYVGSSSWQTSSSTYTQTPTTADYRRPDLDDIRHTGVPVRPLASGDYRVGGEMYGLNIDARVTVTDLEAGGSVQATGSVASTTTPAWMTLSIDNAFTDGGLLLVEWEVRQNATGDPAEWWALRSGEIQTDTAASIPG